MLLVLGATSMARRAGRWDSAAGAWMRDLLARRPARLATVALACGDGSTAPRSMGGDGAPGGLPPRGHAVAPVGAATVAGAAA
jgi:hypothetical protein